MTAIAAVLLVAGCGVLGRADAERRPPDDLVASNAAAIEAAAADAVAAHDLGPAVALARIHGESYVRLPDEDTRRRLATPWGGGDWVPPEGETIVWVVPPMPGEGAPPDQLALISTGAISCGCGCTEHVRYHAARDAAGRLVILRIHLEHRPVRVRRAGTCPLGCGGTPPPPAEPVVVALPAASPDEVAGFVDADAVQEYVVEECDRYQPVP